MDDLDITEINKNINVNYFVDVDNQLVQSTYKNNLNILYFNIQSLRNKLSQLEVLIKSYNCPIHCVILTEIWLNRSENPFYNLPNYTSYFSNRENSYGGVAIFVSDNISSTLIEEEEFNKSNFLVVKLLKLNLNILSVYRSHQTSINDFINKLDDYTVKFQNSIILGDFNINLLNKNSNEVKDYTNMLLSNGFIVLNKISTEYSTRIAKTSKTIIDHAITDVVRSEYLLYIQNTSLSDHQSLFLSMKQKPILDYKTNHKVVLNYINIEKDVIWNNLSSCNSFNDIVKGFSNLITNNTKKIIQKNKIKKHEWMTDEILLKMKIRDSYFKFRKKYYNDPRINKLYNDCNTEVKRLVIQAKIRFYSEYITKNFGNGQKLWKLYKKVMFNKNTNNQCIKFIKHNDKNLTTDFEIAQCINNYFINVTKEVNCPSDAIDYQYMDMFTRVVNNDFDLSPTSLEEVKLAIINLKPAAATGFDHISSKFIKRYSDRLAPVLVKFINNSFATCTFPVSLKTAIVTPIFKNGDAAKISNYRPISILPSFSKIFEIIIKQRLGTFLTKNEFLHKEQFGFEKNSNTTAACLSLTHFITNKIDEGNYVACVFLDFQKAFDCVDHEILLYKMKKMNFNSNQIAFFKSYLHNRDQIVRINETLSQPKTILKGVPQGSILGPDLFKIYINDISFLNLKGSIQLYADDAVLKYSSKSELGLKNDINKDLESIEEWLHKHHLLLNIKKTKILIFDNKKLTNINFYFNNQIVEVVKSFNYLGLIVDSKMKWFEHIDHIIKKISPYIFILKRLRKYFDKSTLYIIYASYILSNIVYLNPIWSKAPQYSLNKLNIMHKKAIKIINNYPYMYPTSLLYDHKYMSFSNICIYEYYMTAFKIINNLIKHHFILNQMFHVHNHNTRNKSNYYLTLFKTNNQNNNCLYNCLKLFNDLPTELKNIDNVVCFKKEIKKYVISINT